MKDKMKCEFPAKSINEGFARVVVGAFAARLDPTVEELAEIKTAVSEAVTNIIIHGYKGREGMAYIECQQDEDTLTVKISDKGEGIEDVSLARTPLYTTNPDGERSGMGFTVMETFMDEVEVKSLAGVGTTVTMKKKIRPDREMSPLIENKTELISLAQQGDSAAMEELIKTNEALIWNVVKRFYGRGCEGEDLFQLGAMGFIKAVKNFDLSRGLKLSTYAVPMIMGEIRRFLRDDGPVKVSRSIRETAIKARRAAEIITLREGREALLSEISALTGINETEIAAALSATERPDSINRPAYNNEESNSSLLDIIEDGKRFDEEIITGISLREAAEKLDSRDKEILVLRYFKNMTQSSVAEIMGISQVQVSRLEKKILSKMKEYMS